MLKKGEERREMTVHISLYSLYSLSTFSTLLFMTLLYFASTEEINPVLSTNQDRRNDGPDSNLWNLSYMCFRSFFKKQALRHHRQVLDGLPAYKNDLLIRTCISWIAINSTTTIIQVFSFSTRKSEIQCRNNKCSEGRTRIYCVSSTHAGERNLFHI